jgi:ubiquinone biosynthesis protein
VRVGVGCYFQQIFEMGFYHADPHAGNLFAMPDGRVAFVDFGRTASISQRNRDAVFDMLLAVFDDDVRGATEAVLTMCGMPSHADIAQLEVELGQIMAGYRRSQTMGGGLDDLVQKLLTMMRVHQLHLPTELTVLLTTLGMVDGVASQIDPDYRLVDVAKPFAKKLLPEQFGPERIIRASLRSVRAYGRLIDELPVQITRVMRRAGEGEFRVSVRPTGFEQMMERLQAGFTLLAYALIVSALIIGSSILVSRPDLTAPEAVGYRLVLFGAVASVIVLLTRMARAEWRKRRADKRSGD